MSLHAQGKVRPQKRLKKTLSLHLMLILPTQSTYTKSKKQTNKTTLKIHREDEESDFLSYYTIRFNAQFSNKKLQGIQTDSYV